MDIYESVTGVKVKASPAQTGKKTELIKCEIVESPFVPSEKGLVFYQNARSFKQDYKLAKPKKSSKHGRKKQVQP